jgi:quinol monooxygenase YgiN
MILIMGEARIRADQRDDALAAMTKVSDISLTEDGCIDYRFWTSISDPNHVLLLEQWYDKAALDAHGRAPHLKEFGAALRMVLDGRFSLTRYEISDSSAM